MELFRVFIVDIEAAISANNEGDNTNSSKDYSIGQMLWLGDKLYRVIRDIDAGATFIVDTNIELVTFEELFNDFISHIKNIICSTDDGSSATATSDRTAGDWIWLNDLLYIVTKNIQRGNAYLFEGDNQNVRVITLEERLDMTYYPNDKKLTIKAKVSDYSEIVTAGDYHVYNPQRQAIEIMRID